MIDKVATDEHIYLAYPRHVAPIAAKKAIAKAVRELAKTMGESMAREVIYEATVAYAASPQGRRTDRVFIPHPATWFNRGGFSDDPEEWQYVNGNGKTRDSLTAAQRAIEAIEDRRSAGDSRDTPPSEIRPRGLPSVCG